jgi:AraC family transcriptional regulator
MAERPINEYDRRMHAVVEYIDRHLDETLELKDLAAVAHFSAFHFHRVFSLWSGEVLGDYLRRRRVEMAAIRLQAQPTVPVLQIALGVGGTTHRPTVCWGCRATASVWMIRR